MKKFSKIVSAAIIASLASTVSAKTFTRDDLTVRLGLEDNHRRMNWKKDVGEDHFSGEFWGFGPSLSVMVFDTFGLTASYERTLKSKHLKRYAEDSVVLQGETPIAAQDVNYYSTATMYSTKFDAHIQKTFNNFRMPIESYAFVGVALSKMRLTSENLTSSTFSLIIQDDFSTPRKAIPRAGIGLNILARDFLGLKLFAAWEGTNSFKVKRNTGVETTDSASIKAKNSFLLGAGLIFQVY